SYPPVSLIPGIGSHAWRPFSRRAGLLAALPVAPPASFLIGMPCFLLRVLPTAPDSRMLAVKKIYSKYRQKINIFNKKYFCVDYLGLKWIICWKPHPARRQ
ncbi:MAG: hypothetical protein PVI27_03485, partial [Desulfobacteraceae bacterium]